MRILNDILSGLSASELEEVAVHLLDVSRIEDLFPAK